MKVRVSDYFASYLAQNGVKHNFTVPGGGAMYLNDSFAQNPDIKCIYVQHEQAAAIAAEAYVRMNNELPLVCCTTGPGGTNTLTGVLGAWLDSIPMLVISGQIRYATTARANQIAVRAMGDQEFDITPMVAHMTKYAVMITNPKMAKYHLQKAIYLAEHGRPGPVWLDVPLDIQSAMIDPEDFVEFNPAELEDTLPPVPGDALLQEIIERIRNAKRPVINAGNAIRIADAYDEFQQVVAQLNIPVVTGFNSIDTIPGDNPLYIGRGGLMGDRAGNWAVQNSDLVLSIGSRLGVRQVGYNVKNWARESFVIMVDVDRNELRKPSIHVELPVHADTKVFLQRLLTVLNGETLPPKPQWLETCTQWKKQYPVVTEKHYAEGNLANAYCFIDVLTKQLPEDSKIVVGNGTAYVAGSQATLIKNGTRFISNSGAASMGYDLPAAIGACFAEDCRETICITGDGSIQMNLQELQTIVFHKLPIKLFVINNQGYHSMRQTEGNLFSEHPRFGVGPESGDLSFPSMERIAAAYGIPYCKVTRNSEMAEVVRQTLAADGFVMCEIFVTLDQKFEPKSATKRLEDGTLVSPPLEDLAPFLPREELKRIMLIPLWPEV